MQRLTEKVYRKNQELDSAKARESMLESQLQDMVKSNKELEEKLRKEMDTLMEARKEMKELERFNTTTKLSYENEKEQVAIIRRENDRLVCV